MKKTANLILKGQSLVFIDWANVHGWTQSLKKEIDLKKLFKYLQRYRQVRETRLYYGTDNHPKSKQFLRSAQKIGYRVITKPVKYILIAEVNRKQIFKRKCDFDMEISLDVHANIQKYDSFVFFSGDGDFEPLYQMLLRHRKQVIVIFAHGHLGREIHGLKGVFKKAIDALGEDLFQKIPPRSLEGRD